MAWTTPGTATAGEVLTAAFWNEQVRDNQSYLYAPPMCALQRTTDQFCANNTDTAIQFGTSLFDTNSMGTTGASAKITIKTAGVYQVSWHLGWDNIGTGVATSYFTAWVKLNASAVRYAQHRERGQSTFDVQPRYSGALAMKLAVNDELTLIARQEGYVAGVNVKASNDFGYPQLSAVWIGYA